MSRHGYIDDWDGDEYSVLAHGRWQAQLQSAIREEGTVWEQPGGTVLT